MTTINVSPSLLADVLTCETKAWTRHVKGYTSPNDAIKAVAGQGFHAGVAVYLDPQSKWPDPRPYALDAFHKVYDPAFARIKVEELSPELTPHNLHRVLARWMEMHPPTALPWRRVLTVEEAFESRRWQFGDVTVRLIVRPDATVEDQYDLIRFLDTKTTGWRVSDAGWQDELRLSLQVGLYTDAVMQRHPGRAALGGWINAVELRKLPESPDRTCATHKVKYAVCGDEHAKALIVECMLTEALVAAAVRDAEIAARRFVELTRGETDAFVSTLDMRGRANRACRFCAAKDWCKADRDPEALPRMMMHEPWPIDEGKRA